MKISVTINRYVREVEYQSAPDIERLLTDLELDEVNHWVACNGKVVPKDEYARLRVNDGDMIEIYPMMAGGIV